MIQSFTIPLKPISWNVLSRKDHWTYTRIFNEWKEATRYALIEAKIKPVTCFPCSIAIHAHWKQKRRHDVDSLLVKPIVDQLIVSKIIPDDNLKYVEMVTFSGEIGAERDELVVTILDHFRSAAKLE